MSAQEKLINDIIAPALDDLGYEIVRIQISAGKHSAGLQVMIDRKDARAIQLEDCETASHHISALLDVEDPFKNPYNLEVSSAGIDRPLTRAKDFAAWLGFDAKIETNQMVNGRRRFKGLLTEFKNNEVTIKVDQDHYAIPLDAIHKAQLILTDALIDEATHRAGPIQSNEELVTEE